MKRKTQADQAQEKLSNAIHDALNCARDRVVRAAVDHVVCAYEGNNYREPFENAVDTFMHIDAIHDALAELQEAKEANTASVPVEPGVIDLDLSPEPRVIDLDKYPVAKKA